MEQDSAEKAVLQDITEGLKHVFSPRDNSPGGAQIVERSGTAAYVEWVYDCTHTGVFQGLKPKGRELTIRGVTIVDDSSGSPVFKRYVDWSEVMTQLGMFANFRPTIETHGAGIEGYP
jgi:hypothetical protein